MRRWRCNLFSVVVFSLLYYCFACAPVFTLQSISYSTLHDMCILTLLSSFHLPLRKSIHFVEFRFDYLLLLVKGKSKIMIDCFDMIWYGVGELYDGCLMVRRHRNIHWLLAVRAVICVLVWGGKTSHSKNDFNLKLIDVAFARALVGVRVVLENQVNHKCIEIGYGGIKIKFCWNFQLTSFVWKGIDIKGRRTESWQ